MFQFGRALLALSINQSNEKNDMSDEVLTIVELSAYLKISRSTLYKLVGEGKIPAQKVGRHWRFRKEAIDRWLEETHIKGSGSIGDQ